MQQHPQNVLMRGCDPVMAQRAMPMLQSALGSNVRIVSVTDDEAFFKQLNSSALADDSSVSKKWDVVMFAPGACRWSKAGQPILGQRTNVGDVGTTTGWRVEDYYPVIQSKQGREDARFWEHVKRRRSCQY